MKHWSIKTKGLVYIIIAALCPLLISGGYIYYSINIETIELKVEKIQLRHEAKDYLYTAHLCSIIEQLETLARNSKLHDKTSDEINSFLNNELAAMNSSHLGLGFVAQDHSVYYTPKNKSTNHSYITAPSSEVDVLIEGDAYDKNGDVIAYISVPVFDSNNIQIGSLYTDYNFSQIYSNNNNVNFNLSSTYIYDVKGNIIFHPNLIPHTNQAIDEYDRIIRSYITQQVQQEVGYSIEHINLKSYVIVHRVVNEGKWVIVDIIPMSEITAGTFPSFVRLFSSIFITIAITVIIFYLFFSSITKRIYNIVKVTKQGANGTFNTQQLDTSVKDEIGILSRSINRMMSSLEVLFSRLDAVINQNKSPVVVLDEHYRFSYLNKAAEEMLGVKAETLIGKTTPISFMDFNEIEKRAADFSKVVGYTVSPGPELFIELRKKYANYDMEFTIVLANGERIPVYDRSSAVRDKNGKMVGIISILQDLSKQREVEQAKNRLQEIVESARDLIASVDRNSNIIYINEAGKRMLGIQGEEITNLKDCLPEDLHKMLIENSLYARTEGYYEMESQFINKRGERINASISIVAHTDMFTGELMYSCVARDLSELLETQKKLVEANELAERAVAAKGNFLALMSHEIRTPLNGIIGLSQLMQKTKLDHLQREYVTKIKDSSDTLLLIVNDILDFSKLEVSKLELEHRLFNINNVIEHVTAQVSFYLGGKDSFEFKVVLDEQLPMLLIGDSLRLEQILNNLCINAVKFTHQGMVELSIAVENISENKLTLKFSVTDTGIGISEEQLAKLFTPFTQADSSTKRQYGGTGLGLVISKNLVNLMGGTLEVTSELHKGSQFSFTLQLQVPEQLSKEQQTSIKVPENQYFAWVIEDHPDMRDYWTELLAHQNIDAISMSSWKEGYYKLCRLGRGALPSVIIIDMEMPDMYGIETWITFKEEALKLQIPVVVLTTTCGREELFKLDEQMQPQLVLTKPIHPYYFHKMLYELLINNSTQTQYELHTSDIQDDSHLSNPELFSSNKSYKVLLVEDNKVNQLVAYEMLKMAHVEVTIANNGLEAIEFLQEETFDLILMDINMPFMDGIEATKWIRARSEYNEIPIVAVTANILKTDHARYLELGIQQVMTKPLELTTVMTMLTDLLGNKGLVTNSLDENMIEQGHELTHKLAAISSLQVDKALERLNGKVNIYLHMLEQFSVDYINFIESLQHYIKVGNLKAAGRMLHTLKGASSYLGAAQLNDIVAKMDNYAQEANVDLLHDYIVLLEKELKRVLLDIAYLLNNS